MASLHELKPRRRLVTYGKPTKRKDQTFNYLEEEKEFGTSNINPIRAQRPHVHNWSSQQQDDLFNLEDSAASSSADVVDTTLKRGRSSRKASPFNYRPRSRVSQASHTSESEVNETSMFDVPSSEEDADPLDSHLARKRRRTTPLRERMPPAVNIRPTPPAVRSQFAQNINASKAGESRNRSVSRSIKMHANSARMVKSQSQKTTAVDKKSDRSRRLPTRVAKPTPVSPESGSPESPERRRREATPVSRICVSTPPKSSPETPVTPKSNRSSRMMVDLLDSHEVIDSMGMSQLRLEPGRASSIQPEEIGRSPSINRFGQPRQRARLIDTLSQSQEEPEAASDASEDEFSELKPIELSENSRQSPYKSSQVATAPTAKHPSHGSLKSEKDPSHESETILGPKLTYAQQRSYLDDMVVEDGLDVGMAALSQMSEISAPGKTNLNNNYSQESQFDFSDDDDVNGTGTLRSIHELRKAGVNARFEGAVESIFEDIESRSKSSNGRRLTGLMQLHEKLTDSEFKQQFLDHQMDKRLAACGTLDQNILGASILASAFSLILCDSQAAMPSIEKCLKRMMRISALLLGEVRNIMEIAKERRQNLSKAINKDVKSFRNQSLNSRIWQSTKPSTLTPRLICLRALEIMIRRARELGNFSLSLTPTIFGMVVSAITDESSNNLEETDTEDRQLLIIIAASILESFTVGISDLDASYLHALKRLPNSSTMSLILAASTSPMTRELLLRLILNITNNNAELCELFAQSSLISTLFKIVHTGFKELTTDSNSAKAESDLNTVILSLGALINFAEWSSTYRSLMTQLELQSQSTNDSYLDILINIFKDHARTFFEASSESQSLSMVAFGYLSVLLCTLCIDGEIRMHVHKQLKSSGGLSRLLQAVEEFLRHFRKVELELEQQQQQQQQQQDTMDVDGDGEAAASGGKPAHRFTERFQRIVNGLRSAEKGG
ncbi:MAG: hypothetical protein Q9227_007579 [Pyrenula ochraceoflavens]